MSWPITPNGLVVLCRQVPLDRQHNNTVDFPDAATQAAAIRVYEKTEFNNVSYMGNGRIYVEATRDDIAMCNYLMYRNTGFSNKWFYAFITELNYINNDTTEIIFEIDNFQTYMFDYQLQRCYVEREHSLTDAIGDNLLDEGLEIGEYVNDGLTPMFNLSTPCIIITIATPLRFDNSTGAWELYPAGVAPTEYIRKIQGEWNGLFVYAFINDVTYNTSLEWQVGRFLQYCESLGVSDSIRSIYLIPQQFITVDHWERRNSDNAAACVVLDQNISPQIPIEISKDTSAFNWNGQSYIPLNNKLHTYPYKCLYITTIDGNAKSYRYEFFTSSPNVYFWWRGNTGNEAGLIAAPNNYKQSGTNYDEKIALADFPQISCASDAWQAYLAQNGNTNALTNLSSALSIVGGVVGVAAGAVSGNAMAVTAGASGVIGGISAIAKLNAKINDIKAQPDNTHGSQSISTISAAGIKNMYYTHKRITPEYARIIDDYFTMFGYACHKVKVPNTNSRPNWNYVKTVDCNIVATSSVDDSTGLNAAAVDDIKAIYNKGVTIWHSLSVVGHYEYNNQPT